VRGLAGRDTHKTSNARDRTFWVTTARQRQNADSVIDFAAIRLRARRTWKNPRQIGCDYPHQDLNPHSAWRNYDGIILGVKPHHF
jgi:hypothetical protein